jgi:hypothetical protein
MTSTQARVGDVYDTYDVLTFLRQSQGKLAQFDLLLLCKTFIYTTLKSMHKIMLCGRKEIWFG